MHSPFVRKSTDPRGSNEGSSDTTENAIARLDIADEEHESNFIDEEKRRMHSERRKVAASLSFTKVGTVKICTERSVKETYSSGSMTKFLQTVE